MIIISVQLCSTESVLLSDKPVIGVRTACKFKAGQCCLRSLMVPVGGVGPVQFGYELSFEDMCTSRTSSSEEYVVRVFLRLHMPAFFT